MQTEFTWLLAPTTIESFRDDFWSKAPLRIPRNNADYYSVLLPEHELEFILQSASRVPRALEVLEEEHRALRNQSFGQVLAAFRNGKSLRIDGIQRFSLPLMTLSRAMERVIGCPININLYLTPGAGKKALSRHYDTHDVFVLQLFGKKVWRLYDPPVEAPLEHLPLQRREGIREMKSLRLRNSQDARDTCTLTEEFAMTPGDMLYLPRGFWHEAESEPGKISCHLTVGVQPTTYLDLMTLALANAASANPRLRASLPYGFTVDRDAVTEIFETMNGLIQHLPADLQVPEALGQLMSITLRGTRAGFESHILQPVDTQLSDYVQGDTPLRVGKGVVFGIDSSLSPAVFVSGSKRFQITEAYEQACRFIARIGEFTPAQVPGELGLTEKLILCRQLVSENVLVLSTPMASASPASPALFEAQRKPQWIPFRIDLNQRSVRWIDIGLRPFTEPFLHQTIRSLQKSVPSTKTKATPLRALLKVQEKTRLAGLIFHISRCGSTLLSNSLKHVDRAIVVSEPQPVGAILDLRARAEGGEDIERAGMLLKGVVQAYGIPRMGDEESLVLKLSSWNLLHLETFRAIWPGVPMVIVVRDPLETAVSCIEDPPGWMQWQKKSPSKLERAFGWTKDEIQAMSAEIFCARMLGMFLSLARQAAAAGSLIVDYRDLTPDRVNEIAKLFGLAVTPDAQRLIVENFSRYSKDPDLKRKHQDDIARKRNQASEELASAIEQWAQPSYRELNQFFAGNTETADRHE
nr:cupin domain-containing protein [Granulicella aggregans]